MKKQYYKKQNLYDKYIDKQILTSSNIERPLSVLELEIKDQIAEQNHKYLVIKNLY